MLKDEFKDRDDQLDNYIYAYCPYCDKAAYHKIKKPMIVMNHKGKLMVYKCKLCHKKWGMFI